MTKEITKPIFIVGCPRSGTTILAKILNNHSQIASATEIHFFNHLCHLKKYNWNNINDNFLETFYNETRVEDFCSLLNIGFKEFEDKFESTSINENLSVIEQNQKRLFDTLMLLLLERNKKTRSCEKTPQHLLSVDKILSLYKDAKIIHLVRDGRDTVNSLVKMPWRPEGLLNNSRFWKQYARAGFLLNQKFGSNSENYISLKYEDLLLNPEASIQALCDFVELEFEDTMLSQKKPSSDNKSNIFSSWESSWKHKAMEELDSTRVGAWQKELSAKDQVLLNWHLKDELDTLGYETSNPNLKASDRVNIFSEYSNLFIKRLTRSITDLIS